LTGKLSKIVKWQPANLPICQIGTMAQWHNGKLPKWHDGTMVKWHDGTMASWQSGIVTAQVGRCGEDEEPYASQGISGRYVSKGNPKSK